MGEGGGRTYDDDEPHELSVGALSAFTRDDVPLLRGADDDLRGVNLLLTELVVSSQLRHGDAITRQTLNKRNNHSSKTLEIMGSIVGDRSGAAHLAEASHHLLYEGAHRSNIDDFEIIHIDGSVHVYMLPDLSQHCHQCDVGLTGSLRTEERQDSPKKDVTL